MKDYSLGSAPGRGILAATVLASGAAFLLGAAVSIALPPVQAFFGGNLSGLQWVVNAGLLTLASLLPIGGSLGDRFGRRRVFLIGIAVFGVAGVFSGFAGSITQLIIFQGVQGVGSALMVPQSLAIINVSFAENRRGQVIGLWAGLSGGIAAAGPWLGGWLVQRFGWPAVFFMSALAGVIAFIVALIFVPETKNPNIHRLDWAGTLLLFLGLFGIAYGLISGASGWTNPMVLFSLIGGTAACLLFVVVEAHQREPVVPPGIFKNSLVTGANLVTLLLYAALNGIMFFCVLNLQQVQGYPPGAAGLALLPTIVVITFLSGPAGSLADKIGPRLPMILGPMVVAIGAVLLAFSGVSTGYLLGFFPGLTLVGLGMALVIAPLTKSALSVASDLSGAASGVNNAAARVAALLAIAVLGAIMLSAFSAHLPVSLAKSGLSSDQQSQILAQRDRLAGITIPETFDASVAQAARRVISESFIYGFRRVMITAAALAFGGGIISALTIRNPARNR